jgi:hypothetical protein
MVKKVSFLLASIPNSVGPESSRSGPTLLGQTRNGLRRGLASVKADIDKASDERLYSLFDRKECAKRACGVSYVKVESSIRENPPYFE